jgi:hypothetical protein
MNERAARHPRQPPETDPELAELEREIEALDSSDEAEPIEVAEPEPPLPEWLPIDEDAMDGRDHTVRLATGEERIARWRGGRNFNGRRWVPGGKWIASDNLTPLPEQPIEYLQYPPTEENEAA